jgi:hypothetical protein
MKLEWNVYTENVNRRKIEVFNIFDHVYFLRDCAKAAKKAETIEDFAKLVSRELHYYYWSKCEWEIILTSWPERQDFNNRKVDVCSQVMLNWDRFIQYLWDNRDELLREAEKSE